MILLATVGSVSWCTTFVIGGDLLEVADICDGIPIRVSMIKD
jgi:hypothetical protein